jgi:hypothetical protein
MFLCYFKPITCAKLRANPRNVNGFFIYFALFLTLLFTAAQTGSFRCISSFGSNDTAPFRGEIFVVLPTGCHSKVREERSG